MNATNEFVVPECLPTIGRFQIFRFGLKSGQILAEIYLGDVHDNIEKCNSGACICNGLCLVSVDVFDGWMQNPPGWQTTRDWDISGVLQLLRLPPPSI